MEYLLSVSITFTVISIYIGYKVKSYRLFDKVVLAFLIFILFHFLFRLIYELFDLPRYFDTVFPFGLVYGPLLHFALLVSYGRKPSIKKALWHFLPFLIALIIALCIYLNAAFRETYYRSYIIALYTIIPVSFFGYILYTVLSNTDRGKIVLYNEVFRMFSFSLVVLFCLGLFFSLNTYMRIIPEVNSGPSLAVYLIYSAMAAQVVAVFRYQVNNLVKVGRMTSRHTPPLVVEEPEVADKYKKSLISQDILDLYEEKLDSLMTQKLFRDPELSLDTIAKHIGAPRHHVTQLISFRKDSNFNQYINKHRIVYACSLLREKGSEWVSLEELAYECGFNSKVSFNRNFKNITQQTPSEYRQSMNRDASI